LTSEAGAVRKKHSIIVLSSVNTSVSHSLFVLNSQHFSANLLWFHSFPSTFPYFL